MGNECVVVALVSGNQLCPNIRDGAFMACNRVGGPGWGGGAIEAYVMSSTRSPRGDSFTAGHLCRRAGILAEPDGQPCPSHDPKGSSGSSVTFRAVQGHAAMFANIVSVTPTSTVMTASV
jgi:hypothetical protein